MKIISGFQSGVDIAAIRAAKAVGFATGGKMTFGFKTEDGFHPEYEQEYGAEQIVSTRYPDRTRWNVRDADATVIFTRTKDSRGTVCALKAITDTGKPYELVVLPRAGMSTEDFDMCMSLIRHRVVRFVSRFECVNIAGNRDADLEAPMQAFLEMVFAEVKQAQEQHPPAAAVPAPVGSEVGGGAGRGEGER